MKLASQFISLLLCLSLHAQQPPQPSAEDLSKFDFWVGTWSLTWEGGKGTNRIEKTLNGRVIQEHFEAIEGNSKGFKGTSISVFSPQDGRWHQAWADNQGSYLNLVGITDGDNRIFQMAQPRKLPDGRESVSRMRFYDITENSLTWDWESSTDGGKTWTLNWRIYYTRVR